MANREDNDTMRIERMFDENKSALFCKMQEMVERKKCVIELKTKCHISEEKRSKLIEYINLLESIILRANQFSEFIPNICRKIDEVEQSTINIQKDITNLEAKRKVELKTSKSNEKTVKTMKKVLSELYSNNFDMLREKENRSLELEKETKKYNFFKEKDVLDCYIKENELLKAKNIRLKEMISLNIEQKI